MMLMPYIKQDRFENGEYRWQAIGMVHGQAVLLVAHTVQDHNGIDHIRIISARQAEKKRGNSMSKTVTYKMDLNNPPVLSAETPTLARVTDIKYTK